MASGPVDGLGTRAYVPPTMLATLIKGFAGKPSHAPLTDVSIGAYTVGVAMLIAGRARLRGGRR